MYFNKHKIKYIILIERMFVRKPASVQLSSAGRNNWVDISTVNISCYFSVASGWLAGSRVNFDSVWVFWSQLGCSPRRRGTAWEPPPWTRLTNTWCQDASHGSIHFMCVGCEYGTHFRFIATWIALTSSLISYCSSTAWPQQTNQGAQHNSSSCIYNRRPNHMHKSKNVK